VIVPNAVEKEKKRKEKKRKEKKRKEKKRKEKKRKEKKRLRFSAIITGASQGGSPENQTLLKTCS